NENIPHELDVVLGRKLSNYLYKEYRRGAFSLEMLRGLAFNRRIVLCSVDMFRIIENAINLLYKKGTEFYIYTFSKKIERLSIEIKKYVCVGRVGVLKKIESIDENIGKDILY